MGQSAQFSALIAVGEPGSWMRVVAGLIGVFAVACLLRWPIAEIPLERDEGEYSYVAERWLAGEPPYQSAFDQKPPGVFAVYAIIFRTLGGSTPAIHWGTQVFTLATLVAIYLVGRRLFGQAAGLAASLLAAYMTVDRCVYGNAANTEVFMILPLTLAFLAALKAGDRSCVFWAAASGMLGTCAIFFKQVALPNVVLNAVILLLAGQHRPRMVAAYVAAAILVVAGVVGYFAFAGALNEFLDCVVLHNLAYAQQVPWYYYPYFLGRTGSVILLQWFPILFFAVTGCFRGRQTELANWSSRRWAVLWLTASFLGTAIGGYFREHYFFQMIPPIAVLAGAGVVWLAERWSAVRSGIVAMALCLGAIAFGVLVMPNYYLFGTPAEKARLLYADAPFPESIPVGEYLAQNAHPEDRVFVYGNEPQILYYSSRRAASRYIYVYPQLTPAPGVLERQDALLNELRSNHPRYIVVHCGLSPYFFDEPPPQHLQVQFVQLLQESYQLVGVVGENDVIVRPFSGAVPIEATLWPPISHTLAIWERKES